MKVLICAASSGGHIYPALSLARELIINDKSYQIIFLCTKKFLDQEILAENHQYQVIFSGFIPPYRKFSKKGTQILTFCLKNFYFLIKFIQESINVFIILCRLKPNIVIGFGGVGSISAILGARVLNIPTLIHEQNIIPGLANRFLMRISTKVAIGFKQTITYFKSKAGNVLYTGNPIRTDLIKIDKEEARKFLGLNKNLFTILVFGGSQGSEFINHCFIQALTLISEDSLKQVQIIHIAGNQHYESVTSEYRKLEFLKSRIKICSFEKDISKLYCAADLLVCRAGAGTLSEISFFSKPAILIPYPYAQAHQKINALYMQQEKAAIVIEQNSNTLKQLVFELERLINDTERLKLLANQCSRLHEDQAVKNLAALVKSSVR
ncbi:MAG: undecaprenyldiphospho-muramoylpentapeptide beta-N-acetylglucosaminyltransferase [Candidatus Omnitrophota bacterium]